MICWLFGNRDKNSPQVRLRLEEVLTELIVTKKIDSILVGHQGGFDRMAISVLKKLQERYKDIRCAVVLAYFPVKEEFALETILPEGQELVPGKAAISRRNQWLLKKADMVVCCVEHIVASNSYELLQHVVQRGIPTINIAEDLISK